MAICSTAFSTLGRAQAGALGNPELPIAVIPHPFGTRTRDEVRDMARQCTTDVVALVTRKSSDESSSQEHKTQD